MKRKTISVTITKTKQVVQFEPLTVTVTEVAELEEGDKASDAKAKLYESVSKSVKQFMEEETTKWKKRAKD